MQVSDSVELGRRAAKRAESRMLIDGELREAASGAGFDNLSPATGKVLGSTAAAIAHDMDAAIGAARRAFDDTDWKSNRELRKRCLLQLQEALEREREDLRDEIIAEVGAPAMTTTMAQVDWPMADALTYPAELIDTFGWEREIGGGTAAETATAPRGQRADGRGGRDRTVELPVRDRRQQTGPGAGHRQYRCAQT